MLSNINIVKKYYEYFNSGDLEAFISLLDEHVVHDINQGETQVGRESFYKFMRHMQRCYDEKIYQLIVMQDESGEKLAARFIVEGNYLITDGPLLTAKGQFYTLSGGAFFEIVNDKITRVTSYYNMYQWLKQMEDENVNAIKN